jgi:hypothetical protein
MPVTNTMPEEKTWQLLVAIGLCTRYNYTFAFVEYSGTYEIWWNDLITYWTGMWVRCRRGSLKIHQNREKHASVKMYSTTQMTTLGSGS